MSYAYTEQQPLSAGGGPQIQTMWGVQASPPEVVRSMYIALGVSLFIALLDFLVSWFANVAALIGWGILGGRFQLIGCWGILG
jgi:hypothetical protein